MNICQTLKCIEEEVIEFTMHVSSVGEESITDYLFWRWELANLSQSFAHLQFTSFTKLEESTTTGADFELEIWLVGSQCSLPLLIQAKKIFKKTNNYRKAFRYPPKNIKHQINTLLKHAQSINHVPLYMFYSKPTSQDNNSNPVPISSEPSDGGIYIAYAKDIETFANTPPRTSITKKEILDKSIHFHELFCPTGNIQNVNKSNMEIITSNIKALLGDKSAMRKELIEQIEFSKTEELPEYVKIMKRKVLGIKEFDIELDLMITKSIENRSEIQTKKIVVINVDSIDL